MDKENIKGAGDKLAGDAKDAAGKATGNDKLRVEGAMDKGKGRAEDMVGDAKDGLRKGPSDNEKS
jgi:uncharacterized protein YjbJ (UPF0337 family)